MTRTLFGPHRARCYLRVCALRQQSPELISTKRFFPALVRLALVIPLPLQVGLVSKRARKISQELPLGTHRPGICCPRFCHVFYSKLSSLLRGEAGLIQKPRKRESISSLPALKFTPRRALQLRHIQLFHRPNFRRDPLHFRGIIAVQPIPDLARHDLPWHAELVL